MRVAKWGNSLAVRLPRAVVEALKLKEGDEIDIRAAEVVAADAISARALEIVAKPTKQELLEQLRSYRGIVPADYRFQRQDAYEPD